MKELIEITDELSSDLLKFKELVREFEVKLNRTTNVIDIIGEIEVSKILGLKMVRDLINPGFDAYDGKQEVQIKATRAKGTNSRVSTLLKKQMHLILTTQSLLNTNTIQILRECIKLQTQVFAVTLITLILQKSL